MFDSIINSFHSARDEGKDIFMANFFTRWVTLPKFKGSLNFFIVLNITYVTQG